MKHRTSLLQSFSRSQLAAFAATVVDYVVLFALVELCGVWYVAATAIGAFVGAVTNFLLNRHWSFLVGDERWAGQAWRYAIVSAGSLILNTAGVYAMTEYLHVHYSISVFAVAISVGIFFNYPLHRYYVFIPTRSPSYERNPAT